jgi:exosortase/archaeosortase family protein
MISRVLGHPATLVAVALAACWPAWAWYASRMAQFPEHRTALVPLAVAVLMIAARRRPQPDPRGRVATAVALLLYAAAFAFVPPLIRAWMAVLVLGVALGAATGAPRLRPGVALLLALALPVVPTAQFYLGYPLRVVAGEAASWMLAVSGWDVTRSGTILDFEGNAVAVDAACSGVRMLWTGLFVAAAIAAARDFGWRQTALLAASATVVVVAGNAVRTVALFFPEARLVQLPSWAHEGIGVACFAFIVLLIAALSRTRAIAWKPCATA